MTNGDMIRTMSDEELALSLMCPEEMGLADMCCPRGDDQNCRQCIYNWLQEVATDDLSD